MARLRSKLGSLWRAVAGRPRAVVASVAGPQSSVDAFQDGTAVLQDGTAALQDGTAAGVELESNTDARSHRCPHVLLIAEMSIPACEQYRVNHRVEQLTLLGCSVAAVNWWHFEACREAIQLADAVIFYRVGAQPLTMGLFEEAARLGLPTFFDVDDVVFDESVFSELASFRSAPKTEQQSLLTGVGYYRAALSMCDHAIASTEPIARRMKDVNRGQIFVVENAVNSHMLWLADRIKRHPIARSSETVVIGYGSGTATHDSDFAEAAPALLHILQTYPNVELAVQGPLQLPAAFAPFTERIVRLPLMPMDDYLRSVATWDISIACLENTPLNLAKSAVKFQEAALVATPSVCSALDPYTCAIVHAETGYLANSTEQWIEALSALVESNTLRSEIGARAQAAVLERCDPMRIAEQQVKPLLDLIQRPADESMRVMVVNDDRPYGNAGAASQMTSRLIAGGQADIVSFSAMTNAELPRHALRAERAHHSTTIEIGCDDVNKPVGQYWDNDVATTFGRILDTCRPDIVCIFDVHRLGVSVASVSSAKGIPYIVSLHSDWWLCAPDENGGPCLPLADDLRRRAARSDDPGLVYHRYFELRETLLNAALLLASDGAHEQRYIEHGLPRELIVSPALETASESETGSTNEAAVTDILKRAIARTRR